MKRCPVCEGLLRESLFKPGSDVCRVCQTRLKENEEGAGFLQARRKTVRQAHIELLLAIYERAVNDDDIATWRSFWMVEEPWPTVWRLLQEAKDHEVEIRQGLKLHVGG